MLTLAHSREIEVALPPALNAYGGAVRARLSGPAGAPLIVALGGISADRFVCDRDDGSPGWWPGLIGTGCVVDPDRFRILGLDFAADATGRYAPSTAEQAEILVAALDSIGVGQAEAIVGASYGGMVALALAERFPTRVRRLAIVSAPAAPHPASSAARELQRRTVALGLAAGMGAEALSIARGAAMLTYRTPEEFAGRFAGGTGKADTLAASEAGLYLRARGDAYGAVMSPERFLSLSASIDRHAVDPARVPHPTLVIGATSDRLVPPEQLHALAEALPDARLHLLDSLYGHDMFLKESERIGRLVAPFLDAR
jgi:homoserine O-acetyltransferase/O-succinyltransferase